MTLLWPWFLLLLLLIPVLIAAYIWALRRRRPFTVRYSSLSLIRAARPQTSRWRRHVPVALFLLAVAALALALSRPLAVVSVPTNQRTIVLAMDVSLSMCSTDVTPNRIQAAKAAAASFVEQQPPGTQIGIVAFSGFAELIQPPTTDKDALQQAIASLVLGRRTAIGSAIQKSLDAIAEIDPAVAPAKPDPSRPEPTPVPKGAYVPDVIVLLTDGASNTGPTPISAAQQAADRGVRVYTIGFGTAAGSEFPNCDPQMVGSEPGGPPGGRGRGGGGGGFGGGFGGFQRGIDEATLKQVASMTGAEYHSAETANELMDALQGLPTYSFTKHQTNELSVAFTALGALLAGLAVVLALLWNPLA